MRRALVVLVLLGSSGAARAQDNPACAKFEEPLAYNSCLAKLGPKAWPSHAAPSGRGRGPASAGQRGRDGRAHMEFDIGK